MEKTASVLGGLVWALLPALSNSETNPLFPYNALSDSLPPKISQTSLYLNVPAKTLPDKAIPYQVNVPLWSDGAAKRRFIVLPKGEKATFHPTGESDFPTGTLFIKEFLVDTVSGDSLSRIHLETRLLIHQNGEWQGLTYAWSKNQQEAWLVPTDGMDASYPERQASPGTGRIEKRWRFPARSECTVCHVSKGRQVLGFLAPQLNLPGPSGTGNQIKDLFAYGVFQGNPPVNFADIHRWSMEEIFPIEWRARSYLASNCSQCHGEKGMQAGATHVKMDFDFFSTEHPMNYLGMRAKKDLDLEGAQVVMPGNPGKSTLTHRMLLRDNLDQMPPLATYDVDSAAVAVMTAWILSQSQGTNPVYLPADSAAAKGSSSPSSPTFDMRGKRNDSKRENGSHRNLRSIKASRSGIHLSP